MAQIIALANQKGGVTKTTSTYNIATSLSYKNYWVLMIDLDPQASLTILAGREPEEFDHNITHFLKGEVEPEKCMYPVNDHLFLVPSIIDLASTELEINGRTAREHTLKKALKKVEDKFDFIFIDCPPQLTVLTLNALTVATSVIIPCQTDYLAYRGLTALQDTISDVKEYLNPNIEILGVIATLFDSRIKDNREILAELQEKYKVLGIIKKTAKANKGIYDGLPVVIFDKYSDIAQEYQKIATYLLQAGQ